MSPLYNRINQVANGFLSISKRKGNALDQLGSFRFIFRHFSGDAVDSSGSRDFNQRFFGSKQNRKSQLSVMSPLHFHYEDVLRQDMLLKLNYTNVMEVPGLCEIRLAPKAGASSDSRMKFGKLAMEILCSQRFFNAKRGPNFQAGKSPRYNSHLGSEKDTSGFARQSTLRGHEMSNFLVRILTVMSMLDSQVQIGENSIKFSMEKEFCEFSPELEDHFEIFEHIGGFNVTIATSANTKEETSLLWSGFLLKDEGETK